MTRLSSALVLALPLLAGCGASSDAMGEIGYAQPPRPRPGYALVVFVRPSGFASGDLYHLFSALQASLAPGRAYFVEVAARYGFWGSKVELIAIAPRFENWASRDEWLAENEAYVLVDRQAFEPGNIASVIGDCQRRLGDYSSDELDQRTLSAGDGL
jgi:hypothetical protein